jgi:hypothetical protein
MKWLCWSVVLWCSNNEVIVLLLWYKQGAPVPSENYGPASETVVVQTVVVRVVTIVSWY